MKVLTAPLNLYVPSANLLTQRRRVYQAAVCPVIVQRPWEREGDPVGSHVTIIDLSIVADCCEHVLHKGSGQEIGRAHV